MRKLIPLAAMLIIGVCLSGCEENQKIDLSAEEIVEKALVAIESPITYYGEFEESDGGKYKEWADSDGKSKLKRRDRLQQTVEMFDGKQLFLYDEENGMVAAIKRSYKDIGFSTRSLRLRSGFLLELVKEQCELSVVGEEKVARRNTYHIVGSQNGGKACIGKPEYWIDQENSMVLKIFENYDERQKVTIEYTKVDFDAKISDDAFVFDFPEGAGVNTIVDPEESSVQEAKEKLGKFFQVPETAEIKLSEIIIFEENKERPEFTFDYTKNGQPEFSVTVFPSSGEIDFGNFRDEEIISAHGQKGINNSNLHSFSYTWLENGLLYTATSKNTELNEEDFIGYLDGMIEVQ